LQGKLKSMQINQNTVGRSVDEALRLLDAYQFVEKHGVVCPANWKPGADTMEADPDGSLQYFSKAESSKDEHSFGHTLTPITSKEHFKEVISGSAPVLVRFPFPFPLSLHCFSDPLGLKCCFADPVVSSSVIGLCASCSNIPQIDLLRLAPTHALSTCCVLMMLAVLCSLI
jgi:hypothetical protein